MNDFAQALTSLVWAMEARALESLIAQVSAVNQSQIDHMARAIVEKGDLLDRLHARDGNASLNTKRRADDFDEKDLDIRGGVARISIAGPMMKQVPSILNWLGIKATSTEAVRAELAAAVESDRVDSIVLDIDSPGGTIDGTAALADDVAAANSLKPVTAIAPDLMASAAMWVGSQAGKIVAGPSAAIGSIGVYGVVADTSRVYENKGIKTYVVSSHELKGAFVDGSHITPAQLDELQRNIDSYTAVFVEAVAKGRNVSAKDVSALATGQVWIGSEALERGLVDEISNTGPEAVRADSRVKFAGASHAVLTPDVTPQAMSEIAAAIPAAVQVTTAAVAALECSGVGPIPALCMESTMTEDEKKEMERLRADAAANKAEREKLEADKAKAEAEAKQMKAEVEKTKALADAEHGRAREALINTYADRFPPATRASLEKYVRGVESHDEAEAFLKNLPKIDRPERESVGSADPNAVADAITGMSALQAHDLAKFTGQSQARIGDSLLIAEHVEHVEHEEYVRDDGKVMMRPIAVMKDGRRVPKAELKKVLPGFRGAAMAVLIGLGSLFAGDANATALSAARQTVCKMNGTTKAYLMEASATIYAGSLVMIDSDGEAVAAAAEASNKNVAGVAQETKTAGASGSYWIKVSDNVICKFAGDTLGQDDVGSTVYADDDQTVDETQTTNAPVAGVMVQYDSASVGWVYVSSLVNFGRVAVTQPLTLTADLTLANDEVLDNDSDDNVCLVGSGGDSDESICFDLDGTNVIALSSGTSAVELDFAALGTTLTLANDQTIVSDTNNEIQFGDNSEDISLGFGTGNTVELSSDTGVVAFDFGAVGTTITFTNDATLATGTANKLTWAENSEDWTWEFGSNVVNFESSTGVVGIDFAAVGTTLTLANDQTIVSDTDNEIQFADGSEDISLGFGTGNTVDVTSDTGVVTWDFNAITTLRMGNDEHILNTSDGVIALGGAGGTNNENLTFDFETTSNVVLVGSGTSVAKVDFQTLNIETDGTIQVLGSGATIGWTAASGGNTACATTCAGTGACVFGYDVGGAVLVACDSADADTCVCAGPAS